MLETSEIHKEESKSFALLIHNQIEKGSLKESVKFVDKYLSDVDEKTKKNTVSERALLNLRNFGKLLKDMLINGSL